MSEPTAPAEPHDIGVGGTVRPITRWGTDVMHRRLKEVTQFDEYLRDFVADLFATMCAADGVGLAANQVGVDLQVFVFDCPDDDLVRHRGVVCNPVLEVPEGEDRNLVEQDEGCLSLPGAFAPCARPDAAVVRGFDENGNAVVFEGTGLFARCLQHETDHLHGTVFGDRLPARARKRLFREAESRAELFGDDWPVSATEATA